MKKKVVWLVVSCLMVLSLVLTSCGQEAPAEKPTAPAEKPTAPAEKPTTPAEKPTTPAEKPAVSKFEGLEPVKLIVNSTDMTKGGLRDQDAFWLSEYLERESEGKIQVQLYRFGTLYGVYDSVKQ